MKTSIAVYCGSSFGRSQAFSAAAESVGHLLGTSGRRLVYGGGAVGLMGIVADSAMSSGAQVIGVIPKRLMLPEVAHNGLTELHVVADMHERKALMSRLSDAFLVLPGGYGTLDEMFEALTWTQLGYQTKPVGVLNVGGFFDPLLEFVARAESSGFLRPGHRDFIVAGNDPADVLRRLDSWSMPPQAKFAFEEGLKP